MFHNEIYADSVYILMILMICLFGFNIFYQ